jgi:hypothetical protein
LLKPENGRSFLKARIVSRILLALSVATRFIWEMSVILLRSKRAIKLRSKIPQQASTVAQFIEFALWHWSSIVCIVHCPGFCLGSAADAFHLPEGLLLPAPFSSGTNCQELGVAQAVASLVESISAQERRPSCSNRAVPKRPHCVRVRMSVVAQQLIRLPLGQHPHQEPSGGQSSWQSRPAELRAAEPSWRDEHQSRASESSAPMTRSRAKQQMDLSRRSRAQDRVEHGRARRKS